MTSVSGWVPPTYTQIEGLPASCDRCGALVLLSYTHNAWHERVDTVLSSVEYDWEVDRER